MIFQKSNLSGPYLYLDFLLNFQPIGSDGTISDEENFENDRVESDFDDASTSSGEDEYARHFANIFHYLNFS